MPVILVSRLWSFWDVLLCNMLHKYESFEGNCCFLLHCKLSSNPTVFIFR